MDAIACLQLQFLALHERSGIPLADISDDQLNWSPPGTANKIGVTLLHAISGEDLFIQQFLQGKPLLWDSQCWAEKIGIPFRPGGPQGWEEASQATLKLPVILQYQQAVITATTDYVAGLTSEDLDRKMPFFGHELPVALLLTICLFHTAEHIGEISALKGVMRPAVPSGK